MPRRRLSRMEEKRNGLWSWTCAWVCSGETHTFFFAFIFLGCNVLINEAITDSKLIWDNCFPASSGLSSSSWWRWLRSEQRRPTKSSWLSRLKHTSAGERIKASRVKLERDLRLCLHARAFVSASAGWKSPSTWQKGTCPLYSPAPRSAFLLWHVAEMLVTNAALSAFDQIYPASNGCYGNLFCSSLFLFLDFMRVALHDSPVNISLIYLIVILSLGAASRLFCVTGASGLYTCVFCLPPAER